MKRLRLLLFCALATSYAFAQQTPVGSWEVVSLKGTDASGKKFSRDTSSIREIKIITQSHYILAAFDVQADSLAFNRMYFGKIRLDNNKYEEQPMASSLPIFDNVKTNYSWKIIQDKFIQSGTLTRPDGKKVVLDELIFKRIKTNTAYPDSPINGTWKLLSSNYTTAEGVNHTDTEAQVTGYHVFTPTHWMYVSIRDKKFEHVMGGSYSMEDSKYTLNLDYASFPKKLWGATEMTHQLEGNKLIIKGQSSFPDGRKFTWEDVLIKLE